MSSQVRQPCQALELPPKSWPQIPWCADQRSASSQELPLGSGMVAGFWVWILGGFLGQKKRTKSPLRDSGGNLMAKTFCLFVEIHRGGE